MSIAGHSCKIDMVKSFENGREKGESTSQCGDQQGWGHTISYPVVLGQVIRGKPIESTAAAHSPSSNGRSTYACRVL